MLKTDVVFDIFEEETEVESHQRRAQKEKKKKDRGHIQMNTSINAMSDKNSSCFVFVIIRFLKQLWIIEFIYSFKSFLT